MTNYSSEHAKYLKQLRFKNVGIKIIQAVILVGFFAIWELAADLKWIDPFIFSSPTRMATALIKMMKDGTIYLHIGVTLWETIVGFVVGTVLGTAVAIVLWWFDFVARVSEPYLVVLNSLPKTALAPILIVWIGNNMTSIIVTALMISVIVTVLNVLNGFLAIDKDKLKLVQTFGGSKRQQLTKVILPASIPTIINALKINVGLSFVGVIVGEFLVAKNGLGYLIVYGSQIFKLDWVMLSVVILGVLSAVLYQMIVVIERKFLKWRE